MVKRRVGKKERKLRERKKVVFLVIDGLADLPIEGKTPLSEAKKPNLEYFAKNGITGELNLIPKKLSVSSHVANVSLLGYNPEKIYLKRGPLEAVGCDLPYVEGNLALRCNFATVDKDLIVLDRHAGRNSLGLDEIARYVNENVDIGVPFILKRTFGHRLVLIIKENLSDRISDSDPGKEGEKVRRVEALEKGAERSAKLLQDFLDKARQVIEFHPANEQRIKNGIAPANYILTREAGNRLVALPNFCKRYKVRAVCISEPGVMKATCLLAGFNAITIPELKFDASLDFIFDNIESSLPEYDFIYAHIKGPDEPAHDGNFHRKREMIEAIDKKLEIFKGFDGVLVVTCDHITSCKFRKHTYGSVPVLVYGLGKDRVKTFDEFSVKKGKLKLITGRKLIKFILGR